MANGITGVELGPSEIYPKLTAAQSIDFRGKLQFAVDRIRPKLAKRNITLVVEDHPTSRLKPRVTQSVGTFEMDAPHNPHDRAYNPSVNLTECPSDPDWVVLVFECDAATSAKCAPGFLRAACAYHDHRVNHVNPLNIWYYEQYIPNCIDMLNNFYNQLPA